MNRGGCRMSGGDGADTGGSLGMISLDDLASVDADGNIGPGGENEATEDEQDDRLLHFWQDVGRGHHVDIPQDMSQPIQQLTTETESTPDREHVPSTLVTRKEKCGDVLYEKRVYEKAVWACIAVREETYEQSICAGFMKLMRYICQQNASGSYLGMTVPIVSVVRTDEARTTLSRDVTVAYYLPYQHQNQPPVPFDPDINLETWPATFVYSRPFSGPNNEITILREINAFSEVLGSPEIGTSGSFIIAGYTSPAATDRRNEVWFLERR